MTFLSAGTRGHAGRWAFSWRWLLYALFAVVFGGIFAFATLKPIRVLPRIRLAPGFSLIDQDGNTLTSEDMRGSIVLYSFLYTHCTGPECDSVKNTLLEVDRRLPETNLGDTPFRFVVISFDPERDTPERLRTYADSLGVDLDHWTFATGEPRLLKYIIGGGFEAYYEKKPDGTYMFDPVFVLVDGWGIIRGEYRYQTQIPNTDRIVRHIGVLAEEVQKSKGAAKAAYEAAHLFLCYAQ